MIEILHNWITDSEEALFLHKCRVALGEETTVKKGTGGNRSRILRYGYDYLTPRWLNEIPFWLQDLSKRIGDFDSITINEYQPGNKIEPHVDSDKFEDLIAILSLGSSCVIRFDKEERTIKEELKPKSMLKMDGIHRTEYKHSIPPVKETRISIVFRKRIV